MSTIFDPQSQIDFLQKQIVELRKELAEAQRRIRRLERRIQIRVYTPEKLPTFTLLSDVPLTDEDK